MLYCHSIWIVSKLLSWTVRHYATTQILPCHFKTKWPATINFSVKFRELMWRIHNNVLSYIETFRFHPIVHSIFIPNWLLLLFHLSSSNQQSARSQTSLLICMSAQLNTKIEKYFHLPLQSISSFLSLSVLSFWSFWRLTAIVLMDSGEVCP